MHVGKLLKASALIALAFAPAPAASQTSATLELESINVEFERQLIQVADNVHVAVGYGASTMSFIEGENGIIVIDAGQLPSETEAALAAYREISGKPIVAIVLTHAHGDHILGAPPLLAEADDIEIYARDNFGSETQGFRSAGITINRVRSIRQAGFRLPPEKRINNGIAPVVYPSGDAFNPSERIEPTVTFAQNLDIEVEGISLSLVANDGETDDQIYIWYPDKRVVFAGDNFYKSWPNLYAIRGTQYRDVQEWAEAVERLLVLEGDVLVGGHTKPIVGKENVREALTTYRDGIRHIFDKTIEGINLGLGPDELVEYAALPPELAEARVLRPYYGNPDWAVRAIFSGYLGWFDGNATNLFPLAPAEEARQMARLAGGTENLLAHLRYSNATGEFQWAAQLADYVLALDPDNTDALIGKADALDALAQHNVTSTARNYYQTYAQELRAKAAAPSPAAE